MKIEEFCNKIKLAHLFISTYNLTAARDSLAPKLCTRGWPLVCLICSLASL